MTPNDATERKKIFRAEFLLPLLVTVIGGVIVAYLTGAIPPRQPVATSTALDAMQPAVATPLVTATNTDVPVIASPTFTHTPEPIIVPSETPSTVVIFSDGEPRQSTHQDFTVRVAKIELRPNDRMRWYFEFWNQTNTGVLFGLDQSRIVLSDEFGNQYAVIDGSTFPNKSFEETVSAGVKSELWMDFDAPISNAKKFQVSLVAANYYWHPSYGVFGVDVTYDSTDTPSAPAATVAAGTTVIFENGDFLNTTLPDFIVRVARVDLRPNNKMRWYFEFWNKADKAALFGLDHAKMVLADENGHQYTVLDASTYPNKSFEQSVPAGVMEKLWMDFDAPMNNARVFKVTIVPANPYWHPHYDVFTVNLP